MGTIPGLKVELAFGSGFSTPESSRTWTDVTPSDAGAAGISITRGRSDEQSQPSPSTCTLTLENIDGRFTPGYTGGAFYPNVVKGVPLRVSVIYAGTTYVRFTGYVNEWPVQWPTGGDTYSTVTITASSRRARLGQTAPLPSAIRAAYLATSPVSYWPMDEDTDFFTRGGQQAFSDITNRANGVIETELIASFSSSDSLTPVVRDGTAGPTDEQSLVRFPRYANSALLGTFPHYVGGGGVFNLPGVAGLTVECLMRVEANASALSLTTPISLYTGDLNWGLFAHVGGDGGGDFGYVGLEMMYRDPVTGAVLDDKTSAGYPLPYNPVDFATATDGDIHHYAITLTGGTTASLYFDGNLLATLALTPPYVFNRSFTGLGLGVDTYNTTAWIGHAAIHNRPLSAAEIAVRAAAATAASEGVAERVVRLATYLGVPASEVDVEASIAAPLGSQPEKGNSAAAVIDEIASSTGGVAFDARNGHFTMQARNHRYNAASIFTLSATADEIEADLTPTLDDRYLINSVEVSRSTAPSGTLPLSFSDAASIDTYGLYAQSLQMVSSSDDEAEALGYATLTRYSTPKVRVSQVSVDIGDLGASSLTYGAGLYGAGIYPAITQQQLVMAVDIGSKITLANLPVQAPASSMDLFVEGYTESISTTAGHLMTLNTTPGDQDGPFLMLDDPTYGLLGTGVAGDNLLPY